MGFRLNQRIPNRNISIGQKTINELLYILCHQGNSNQRTLRHTLTAVKMAKIKKTEDAFC